MFWTAAPVALRGWGLVGPVIEAAEMGEVPPLVIPGGETSPGVKDREKKMSRRGCVRCLREVWMVSALWHL